MSDLPSLYKTLIKWHKSEHVSQTLQVNKWTSDQIGCFYYRLMHRKWCVLESLRTTCLGLSEGLKKLVIKSKKSQHNIFLKEQFQTSVRSILHYIIYKSLVDSAQLCLRQRVHRNNSPSWVAFKYCLLLSFW